MLFFFTSGPLTAQSKWLFNPGIYVDNPFENEIGGGTIIAGLEYRPKVFFGLETSVKYGFYGFSASLFPDPQGVPGVYSPNGYMQYRFESPQIAIAPRLYYDLDIFYDGLSLYAESEFSTGVLYGDITITGDAPYDNTFSESISYYSVSIGLEYWEDRSHSKKRDVIIAGSIGVGFWDLKKTYKKYRPDSYNGPNPLLDPPLLRIGLTFKVPIGTNLGSDSVRQ